MSETIKLDNDNTDDDGSSFTFNPDSWDYTWPFKENTDGLKLDFEAADRITICNLKQYLDNIYEREHDNKVFGSFYHDDDKKVDRKVKKAIKRVLRYLGEDVE